MSESLFIDCGCTSSSDICPNLQQQSTQCPICGILSDKSPAFLTDDSSTRKLRHRTPVQLNPYAVESTAYRQKLGKSARTKPRYSSKKANKEGKKVGDLKHDSHDAVLDLIDEYAENMGGNAAVADVQNVEMDIIAGYAQDNPGYQEERNRHMVNPDTYNEGNLTRQDFEAALILQKIRGHSDQRMSAMSVEGGRSIQYCGSVSIDASDSSSLTFCSDYSSA